jgi:tetratricopeptide (TPR) repeat protein
LAYGIVALAALVFTAVLAHRSRSRIFAFALLWLAVPFAPTWIIPNSDLFNESRAYFAFGGFALLAALIVHDSNASKIFRATLSVLLVSVLIPVSLSRNRLWNDDVALWTQAATRSPGKPRVRYNLGSALARRGRVEAARREFETARDLNPLDDLSYAALGYCAEILEDWELAETHYARALDLSPDNDYAREGWSRARLRLRTMQDSATGSFPADEASPRSPGTTRRP